MYLLVKRVVDIVISAVFVGVLMCSGPLNLDTFQATPKDSVICYSDRVGRNNCIFKMPKLRAMKSCIPEVVTHLLEIQQNLVNF
jgi:O-antigen biosynthesis protein WbqP